MAYLYGASIQGIQGFIFETNKLKEIVGASNLIEQFTSKDFIDGFINDKDTKYNLLRNAGGNIRIVFNDSQKELAQKFVKEFPQYIMKKAYGITLSQSILDYTTEKYEDIAKKLELQLKNARNKIYLPLDAKFSLMEQSSRTGKPATKTITYPDKTTEIVDRGTFQKHTNAKPAHKNLLLDKIGIHKNQYEYFPLDLSQISNSKNKIAVIHADGNKMGLLLQQMSEKLKDKTSKEIQDAFKNFSTNIEASTKDAITQAFTNTFNINDYDEKEQVPFRPIVVGGDDVTVICHADKAIEFIKQYMDLFQTNTKNSLAEIVATYELDTFSEGLTACAGIAYCNEKFPFHYAVSVAEVLCGRAKKASEREASCLLFHNIQGAAFTDYEQYVQNELQLDNGSRVTSLEFGPYYVSEQNMGIEKPSINVLLDVYAEMKKDTFPLGKFREWLSELALDDEYAKKYLERVNIMAKKDTKIDVDRLNQVLGKLGDISLESLLDNHNKTPMHDILQLKSVQGGK